MKKKTAKQERLEQEARDAARYRAEYLEGEKLRARNFVKATGHTGLPDNALDAVVEALFKIGRRFEAYIAPLPPLPEPMKFRPALWVIDPRDYARPWAARGQSGTGRPYPSVATLYKARMRFFPHQAVALDELDGHLVPCDKASPACIGGVMPEEDQLRLNRMARRKRK